LQGKPPLVPELATPIGKQVLRIVAGNAGLMTGPGTNTYILGSTLRAVIDPGPVDQVHLEAILQQSGDGIRWILTTHTHRDHSPLSLELAKRTGATIIGSPPPNDGRQDDTYASQRAPHDGERLVLGDLELIAIHTPGHASNCVCYLWEQENLLFTGDHILEGVSPVILPPDGDMRAYFHSLDKLLDRPFERIAPGHGHVMDNGKQAITALRGHRQAREDKVMRHLKQLQPATLDALLAPVYDDVPADRHAWARLTLEAHLIKLKDEGKVLERAGVYSSVQA
jgi:glyoxylase-like metal-dependent hydrolase (beta-lactamase superfamily II)